MLCVTKTRRCAYQASCATFCLNSCEYVMNIKCTGKLFHCCIVLSMKLYLYALHDVLTHVSRLLRVLWEYRDFARRYWGSAIWALPWRILWNMVRRRTFRRFYRMSQFSSRYSEVTVPGSRLYSFFMKRVARRWTASSCFLSFCRYGTFVEITLKETEVSIRLCGGLVDVFGPL